MPRKISLGRARTDGRPHRAVTSVNVRHEDKAVFDHLHSFLVIRERRPLSQWDAFSIVLRAALGNPKLDVPADVARPREP